MPTAPLPDQASREGLGSLTDWLVVALLLVTSLVSMVDRFALSLLVEPIKAAMDLTDGQLGLLTGMAFGLFYAAMSLPMGWLADRWSRKACIVLGLAVWGLATAACGLAANAWQFAAARMIVGIGEAALAPCAYGIIHDRIPPRALGRAMSTYQMGGMLGAGFAFFVAGLAYNFFLAHQGLALPLIGGLAPWQQTFVALALPCLPVMALLLLMREGPRARVLPSPSTASEPANVLSALRARAGLYASAFFGIAAIILVTYALLSWMPAILMREFHWSALAVGSSYGVVVVVTSILGLIVGGSAVDAMAARGVAHPHLLLSGWVALASLVLVVALALAKGAVALLVVAGALHFCMAAPIGIIPAYVQIISPRTVRGQVSSLYVLCVNIVGQTVGPAAIGFVSGLDPASPTGLRHGVCLVSAVSLGLALVLVRLARKLSHSPLEETR